MSRYKILESHIQFNVDEGETPHIVIVAIQSDPNEKGATHFKAYWKHVKGVIQMETYQQVAASGSKMAKEAAFETFPSLKHLGYY